MRGLRAVAGHGAALARYWNRPMGTGWRHDFALQFCGLLVLCIYGAPWSYIGTGFFGLLVLHWTWRTIRGYRRGERARSRYHNHSGTWKDGQDG